MNGQFFPNAAPHRDLSPEEMTKIARRFCRRARLVDAGFLLFLLVMAIGYFKNSTPLMWSALVLLVVDQLCAFLLFCRCPCCGRLVNRRSETMRMFVWRGYECPVCYFSPDWRK